MRPSGWDGKPSPPHTLAPKVGVGLEQSRCNFPHPRPPELLEKGGAAFIFHWIYGKLLPLLV